ncbi:PLC-like phosphodiesterase [Xylariales sp. PMI_506]|nr:PLC-like phosphodiesterase [Xylariales sp. PMI_506]
MASVQAGLLLLLARGAFGQISVSDSRTTETSVSVTASEDATPTGSYLSYASQESQGTALGSISSLASSLIASNVSQSTVSTTTDTVTYLTGTSKSSTLSGNFSTTATTVATPTVTNTQPCNNYAEFCNRQYGNVTEVACHNSPFTTANNLAANQEYTVKYQLDDGVRFLQAQIQWPSNATVPHFCHTSCDILDAGPITDWLTDVKNWVASHPYDVVTILLGNGNYSAPSLYAPYIESTGILSYVYTPPLVPMTLSDWPTLGEMILSGKRVVMFMDYEANQTAYPWLLDEFSQMWETEFDPTNQSFPCDVQRPPDLSSDDTVTRLSIANHNLNIELTVLGTSLLIPARSELNVTNNVTGYGSVGLAGQNCLSEWGRPPTFLNVDYYNAGFTAGSVFEAAAEFNNVTYTRKCCGPSASAASKLSLGTTLNSKLLWIVGAVTSYLVLGLE